LITLHCKKWPNQGVECLQFIITVWNNLYIYISELGNVILAHRYPKTQVHVQFRNINNVA